MSDRGSEESGRASTRRRARKRANRKGTQQPGDNNDTIPEEHADDSHTPAEFTIIGHSSNPQQNSDHNASQSSQYQSHRSSNLGRSHQSHDIRNEPEFATFKPSYTSSDERSTYPEPASDLRSIINRSNRPQQHNSPSDSSHSTQPMQNAHQPPPHRGQEADARGRGNTRGAGLSGSRSRFEHARGQEKAPAAQASQAEQSTTSTPVTPATQKAGLLGGPSRYRPSDSTQTTPHSSAPEVQALQAEQSATSTASNPVTPATQKTGLLGGHSNYKPSDVTQTTSSSPASEVQHTIPATPGAQKGSLMGGSSKHMPSESQDNSSYSNRGDLRPKPADVSQLDQQPVAEDPNVTATSTKRISILPRPAPLVLDAPTAAPTFPALSSSAQPSPASDSTSSRKGKSIQQSPAASSSSDNYEKTPAYLSFPSLAATKSASPKPAHQTGPSPAASSGQGRDTLTCLRCKEVGHTARNCDIVVANGIKKLKRSAQWLKDDWRCAACTAHCRAAQEVCRCGSAERKWVSETSRRIMPGDWKCGGCGAHVDAASEVCKCGAAKGEASSVANYQYEKHLCHSFSGFVAPAGPAAMVLGQADLNLNDTSLGSRMTPEMEAEYLAKLGFPLSQRDSNDRLVLYGDSRLPAGGGRPAGWIAKEWRDHKAILKQISRKAERAAEEGLAPLGEVEEMGAGVEKTELGGDETRVEAVKDVVLAGGEAQTDSTPDPLDVGSDVAIVAEVNTLEDPSHPWSGEEEEGVLDQLWKLTMQDHTADNVQSTEAAFVSLVQALVAAGGERRERQLRRQFDEHVASVDSSIAALQAVRDEAHAGQADMAALKAEVETLKADNQSLVATVDASRQGEQAAVAAREAALSQLQASTKAGDLERSRLEASMERERGLKEAKEAEVGEVKAELREERLAMRKAAEEQKRERGDLEELAEEHRALEEKWQAALKAKDDLSKDARSYKQALVEVVKQARDLGDPIEAGASPIAQLHMLSDKIAGLKGKVEAAKVAVAAANKANAERLHAVELAAADAAAAAASAESRNAAAVAKNDGMLGEVQRLTVELLRAQEDLVSARQSADVSKEILACLADTMRDPDVELVSVADHNLEELAQGLADMVGPKMEQLSQQDSEIQELREELREVKDNAAASANSTTIAEETAMDEDAGDEKVIETSHVGTQTDSAPTRAVVSQGTSMDEVAGDDRTVETSHIGTQTETAPSLIFVSQGTSMNEVVGDVRVAETCHTGTQTSPPPTFSAVSQGTSMDEDAGEIKTVETSHSGTQTDPAPALPIVPEPAPTTPTFVTITTGPVIQPGWTFRDALTWSMLFAAGLAALVFGYEAFRSHVERSQWQAANTETVAMLWRMQGGQDGSIDDALAKTAHAVLDWFGVGE